jgi:hypothetical protein
MVFAVALLLVLALVLVALFFGFTWYYRELKKGSANLVCPHCQTQGRVSRTPATRKRGISGGKATAAVFTGGTSLLATGLSRKQHVMAMYCGNCRTRWDA